MAALSGKSGKIEYGGGKVVNIRAWSLDLDTNLIDTTAWSTGTDQWRSYTPGLSGGSGSITAFFDEASTGQKDMRTKTLTPSTAQLILYVDKSGGANFRGSSLIERLGLDVDIDGSADASYDFRFTGAVTYSSAT